MITIHVNGQRHKLDIDHDTPLLWVLNEQLGLTGTRYSCGIGECGACSVLIDGRVELSCSTPVGSIEGMEITTIEGLQGPQAKALRRAWLSEDVAQCGYCQSGQLITAADLLQNNPNPDDDAINAAMSGVLCRCGTYQGIRNAIHLAAKELSDEKG